MSRFGPTVVQAFEVAAGELGMCSAAWLFVREVAREGSDELVAELRDLLGRSFPVLDAVAATWLAGARAPVVDSDRVLQACAGASQVVIVGAETLFLDDLLPRMGTTRAALVTHGTFAVDWDRVVANYPGYLDPVDLSSFQRLAGRRSVLLTFVYGTQGESTWVDPTWLRIMGPDVRTQFRSIVGWDVLGGAPYLYPRWVVEASLADFSEVIRA